MSIEELYHIYISHPSVQTDTRKLKPGDIFFALKGSNFNGNQFALQALNDGASHIVIDEKEFMVPGKTILVEDVLTTLQALALHHRKQFNTSPAGRQVPFIGITGSNGKTTTKELIHAVLASTFKTHTTEGNLNNHIGVPLTLLRMKRSTEIAVIEMGANHPGEIASYCKYALPTHGIITNCGKAHLEGFGSIEGVRNAKGELYDHLRSSNEGTAFVMWDYDYLQEMSKGISGIIKYGTTEESHVIGRVGKNDPYLEVEFVQGIDEKTISTKLVGEYNLPNVLAAVTVGKFFNVPDNKIKEAIENYTPSNSRSQLIKKGTNTIILDAYNANPSSMKLAIENMAAISSENKVLLLGAMAELGKNSLEEHGIIIEQLKLHDWKAVILVGGDFLKTDHPFISFPDADKAGEWLASQDFQDSHILVKGSRSIQMEKVLSHIQD